MTPERPERPQDSPESDETARRVPQDPGNGVGPHSVPTPPLWTITPDDYATDPNKRDVADRIMKHYGLSHVSLIEAYPDHAVVTTFDTCSDGKFIVSDDEVATTQHRVDWFQEAAQ
ncbi:MAG: hypothetical protein KA129_10100 [Microthrixaceae bacterium]|nr:hypothetical protein [Microthrixaceae bacterium]